MPGTSLQISSLIFYALSLIVEKIQKNVTVASAVTLETEGGAWWELTSRTSMYQLQGHAVWGWHTGVLLDSHIRISNRRAAAIASAEIDKSPLQGFLHGQMRNYLKAWDSAQSPDWSPWLKGQGHFSPSPLGMHFPFLFNQWLLGQSCQRPI